MGNPQKNISIQTSFNNEIQKLLKQNNIKSKRNKRRRKTRGLQNKRNKRASETKQHKIETKQKKKKNARITKQTKQIKERNSLTLQNLKYFLHSNLFSLLKPPLCLFILISHTHQNQATKF